jgi:hypothetical protein
MLLNGPLPSVTEQVRQIHRRIRVVRLVTTNDSQRIVGLLIPNSAVESVLTGLFLMSQRSSHNLKSISCGQNPTGTICSLKKIDSVDYCSYLGVGRLNCMMLPCIYNMC